MDLTMCLVVVLSLVMDLRPSALCHLGSLVLCASAVQRDYSVQEGECRIGSPCECSRGMVSYLRRFHSNYGSWMFRDYAQQLQSPLFLSSCSSWQYVSMTIYAWIDALCIDFFRSLGPLSGSWYASLLTLWLQYGKEVVELVCRRADADPKWKDWFPVLPPVPILYDKLHATSIAQSDATAVSEGPEQPSPSIAVSAPVSSANSASSNQQPPPRRLRGFKNP